MHQLLCKVIHKGDFASIACTYLQHSRNIPSACTATQIDLYALFGRYPRVRHALGQASGQNTQQRDGTLFILASRLSTQLLCRCQFLENIAANSAERCNILRARTRPAPQCSPAPSYYASYVSARHSTALSTHLFDSNSRLLFLALR